ncbi:MAG TPA: alpha-ketoglutarate-dependent dioxygenase AlkB [Rhizomicrobium sp.]|jgi:alkylated DNA repair protein (DNA oxidative demethylase)|nr:alpha-ketoglutarate-dependent dioxygenase AlkB [Rhizomicrobium sp.]
MNMLTVAPGVVLWREYFDRAAQKSLVETVFELAEQAPFYKPLMPKTARPFSVVETNFGTLGWMSDETGYRYQAMHPVTDAAWPAIPDVLLGLWRRVAGFPALPECCLVNLYREGAKMGAHRDADEEERDAPVVSVSLGDDALFRIGGNTRKGPTRSLKLSSGDVLVFGGPARDAFHGIDRIVTGTSTLVPEGGRLNLTLRRVKRLAK